jgi:putative serine protease PepD
MFKDSKIYDARLVVSDPSTEAAVLRIDPPSGELKPPPLGNSSKLQVGPPVVAIGDPQDYSGTETQGILSALNRDMQTSNRFAIPSAIHRPTPP